MKKKIINLFMSIISIFGIIIVFQSIKVSAATSGDYSYTVVNDTAVFNNYTGTATEIEIPAEIDGYPVTKIGHSAFKDCRDLKSIIIPDSVIEIDYYAFENCSGLTSITIPEGVIVIGNYAFNGCSGLTSITIPEGVIVIGNYAFNGCSGLTSITIPEGVFKIANNVFRNCSGLTSITIPKSVTEIGEYAFNGCSGLTSITIPEGVTEINKYAFNKCSGLTSITIPDGVTEIAMNTFDGCSKLTSIIIPESVTEISMYAFSGCSGLTSITIPESVNKIGSNAFFLCSGLTSISIPNSVTRMDYNIFSTCTNLKEIKVDDNNLSYADIDGVLLNKDLTETVAVPAGKTGDYVIPDGVTSIASHSFSGCSKLTSITIPNSVVSIDYGAFYGCFGLTSITIPDSVEKMDARVFEGCSNLTSVTFGEGIKSIPDYTFVYCNKLETVNLPEGLESIGYGAFQFCSLKEINLPSTLTSIGGYAFQNCDFESVVIPEGVTSVENGTFCQCYGLKYVTLPENMTVIGDYAFQEAPIITFTVPNGVSEIGSNAFQFCSSLKKITIPDSVASIDSTAFYGCENFTVVANKSSYAKTFADDNNISFKDLSSIITKDFSVNVHAGYVEKDTVVTLKKGADRVFYTTDMTDPSVSETRQELTDEKTFQITDTSIIKAVSFRNDNYSEIETYTYIVKEKSEKPLTGICLAVNVGNEPFGLEIPEETVKKRVETISKVTDRIRTFSTLFGNQYVPKYNENVMVGVYITDSATQNDEQINGLIAMLETDYAENIEMIAVGNETALLGVTDEILYSCISRVRQAVMDSGHLIPIGTVQTYGTPLSDEIKGQLDFLGVNIYAGTWDQVPAENASTALENTWADASDTDKFVLITETGMPYSDVGETSYRLPDGGIKPAPTEENAKNYFKHFLEWTNTNKVPAYYFQAFEQSYSVKNSHIIEPFFHIADRNLEILKIYRTVINDYRISVGITEDVFYTVQFLNSDGTELKMQDVAYGKPATAPEDPKRDGYEFIGWDKGFASVTSDMSITAKYRVRKDSTYEIDEPGEVDGKDLEEYDEIIISSEGVTLVGGNLNGNVRVEAERAVLKNLTIAGNVYLSAKDTEMSDSTVVGSLSASAQSIALTNLTIEGNLSIGDTNITVHGGTVGGNLTIERSVGDGWAEISGVTAQETIMYIRGGGSNSNSIIVEDSVFGAIVVEKDVTAGEQTVRVAVEGTTQVANTIVNSAAIIEDKTEEGDGLQNVTLTEIIPTASTVELRGEIKEVTVQKEKIEVVNNAVIEKLDLEVNAVILVNNASVAALNVGKEVDMARIEGKEIEQIIVSNGGKEPQYVKKRGDPTDDGEVNIFDIMAVRNVIFGIEKMTGNKFAAADLDWDGELNIFDIMAIRDLIFS